MDVNEHPLLARRRRVLAAIKALEEEARELLERYERERDGFTGEILKTEHGAVPVYRPTEAQAGLDKWMNTPAYRGPQHEAEAAAMREAVDRLTGRANHEKDTSRGVHAPAVGCSCPRYPGGGRQSTDPQCALHSGDPRD